MVRNDYLYCLYDRGRIKSIGRFVTRLGESIEIGSCNFDGFISGFRWNAETGWEAVFLRHADSDTGQGVVSIMDDSGENHYTSAELDVELTLFLKKARPFDH